MKPTAKKPGLSKMLDTLSRIWTVSIVKETSDRYALKLRVQREPLMSRRRAGVHHSSFMVYEGPTLLGVVLRAYIDNVNV